MEDLLIMVGVSSAVLAVFAVAARLLGGDRNGDNDGEDSWWQAIK